STDGPARALRRPDHPSTSRPGGGSSHECSGAHADQVRGSTKRSCTTSGGAVTTRTLWIGRGTAPPYPTGGSDAAAVAIDWGARRVPGFERGHDRTARQLPPPLPRLRLRGPPPGRAPRAHRG